MGGTQPKREHDRVIQRREYLLRVCQFAVLRRSPWNFSRIPHGNLFSSIRWDINKNRVVLICAASPIAYLRLAVFRPAVGGSERRRNDPTRCHDSEG
jgi:hypothetical protein